MELSSLKKVIPNFFTALNMALGFYSVVETTNGNFHFAALLIGFAAVSDALDGLFARLTNTSSKLGVELDSLADVVSFGFAPAFLLWKTYLFNYEYVGLLISVLFLIAGGYRLARFNTQLVGFDKDYFSGLPIPMAAITVSSFILVYTEGTAIRPPYQELIIPLTLLLSLLMISKIKYDTLPKPSLKSIKEKPFLFIFIIIAAIIFVLSEGKAIFYIFIFVIVFGIFRQLFNFIRQK
ncbi:MAG: CDP-diacylglycerol--serine O-phosphatidyltransferase [Ignavibacteria bacterium]|nr:CDP-diacylglycerol--serine O-phosphatidyltransferase [Ignavibacteria bacterium]MDP3829972.1 CDP-diacylglycerol--serine O-phosphatidyltransferase [Ignavibacteriaceae bacterium]